MGEENKNIAHREKIIQLVVFRLDEEEYAMPVEDVQVVINMTEITPVPNSPSFVAGLINLRGKVIPVIDLEKRFGLQRNNSNIELKHIVVIDIPNSSFGVIVDEVIEVLHISKNVVQANPEVVNNKIGAEYIKGVIVIGIDDAEADKDVAEAVKKTKKRKKEDGLKQRIMLVLSLKDIFTEKERQVMEKVSEKKSNESDNDSKKPADKQ
ncbi:MAG: hypothetical protein COX30_02000 [Candidatus Moranbacteria bacterium CG23_combo_of_CG06-09_8_20_14_all_39_10]|nr:MAG: hypothetical protein COX30_02000 [Candidatus Moranbacteria bacterium CG23_combo_of_CG06-09_8_20_14_all_39_10]